MTRLFRRAGRVEVRVDGTVYKRRGAVFAAARGAEETAPDLRRCGRRCRRLRCALRTTGRFPAGRRGPSSA
nr:MAG TPA: hypothetical protein [Caudoviricetes sp.]